MRSAKRQLVQRRRRRDDTLPGHDSFLDIVANLVGILIILVVVVGAQAGAALVPAAPSESTTASLQAKTEELAKQLETEKLKSLSLNDDRAKLEANIQTEELQAEEGNVLSEAQARAILDMRLQKLTGLERDKVQGEYEEVKKLIAELKAILESE